MRIDQLALAAAMALTVAGITGCNEDEPTVEDNTIKVFKLSGAVQCQDNTGTPLDEMRLELINAGIDVLCGQEALDGAVYAAVCGAPTGLINVYEIRAANEPDAEQLGFENVLSLPDYQDTQCQ